MVCTSQAFCTLVPNCSVRFLNNINILGWIFSITFNSFCVSEALNAIVIYTRNGEELLKRRKVRREHLYQYLAQEGHVEHPASDKITLLKRVLKLWEARRQKVYTAYKLCINACMQMPPPVNSLIDIKLATKNCFYICEESFTLLLYCFDFVR